MRKCQKTFNRLSPIVQKRGYVAVLYFHIFSFYGPQNHDSNRASHPEDQTQLGAQFSTVDP